MSRIDVVQDGKKFKVMVNFVTRGEYQSPAVANIQAQNIQKNESPHYTLNPFTVQPIPVNT